MPNLYNNEIIFNGQTLMSLKEDTVTPDKVLAGETFHDRSGAPQTGNLITHNVYDGLDSTSASDALSANQGRVLNEKYNALDSNIANGSKIICGQATIPAGNDRIMFNYGHTFTNLPNIQLTALNDGNGGVVFTSFDITRTYAVALLRSGIITNNQRIDWLAIGK